MEEVKKIKKTEKDTKSVKKTSNTKKSAYKKDDKVKKTQSTKKNTNASKNKNTKKKDDVVKQKSTKKETSVKTKTISSKAKTNKEHVSKKVLVKKELKNKDKIKGPDLDLKKLETDIKKDIKNNFFVRHQIIISTILLVFLIIIFIGLHFLIPRMNILGSTNITINYNEEYKEQGVQADFFGQDLSRKVKIAGNVDTTKVGKYEITYILKEGKYKIEKKRVVNVVDTKKPVITLEDVEEIKVCPKTEKYKQITYKAIDEYDGDITDKVEIKKTENEFIYSVKDSSGNLESVTKKIKVIDDTAPTITLKGNKTLYLTPSENYTEPGYSASDNCSGDLTSKVTVSGKVENGKEGTYYISYTVSDDSSNITKVTRTIIVSHKTNPNSGVVRNGVIYLTFDDGPSSVTTGAILDVLKEEGIKATFFVTNNGPDYLIKRMYDEGHTVALHTASHDYSKIYASTENYFSDLKKVSDRVKRITGQTSKIVRFPGGSSNTISRKYNSGIMTKLVNELFSRGYRYYDWNIDSQDASTAKTKQAVYKNVTTRLSKNKANMVLMHDIKVPTRDAIRDIIKYGKDNGYIFDRIDMNTYMVRQSVRN